MGIDLNDEAQRALFADPAKRLKEARDKLRAELSPVVARVLVTSLDEALFESFLTYKTEAEHFAEVAALTGEPDFAREAAGAEARAAQSWAALFGDRDS